MDVAKKTRKTYSSALNDKEWAAIETPRPGALPSQELPVSNHQYHRLYVKHDDRCRALLLLNEGQYVRELELESNEEHQYHLARSAAHHPPSRSLVQSRHYQQLRP